MKKKTRQRDFKTLEEKPRKHYYTRCGFNIRDFDMRLWEPPDMVRAAVKTKLSRTG